MEIAVSVTGLSKKYHMYNKPLDRLKEAFHPRRHTYHREFWALKNISFELPKGEALGIIGRNGCGKSTLLQIVSGILQPTSGAVRVNGRISALLELGSGFNPEFTGRSNVYMNGALMGISKKEMEDKFKAIETFAEIGDFIDQPVKTYSSGMFVRLAFACAISVEPDILVVDEALSVGDVFFQQKCFAKIREIISKGTTCLFVSHDTAAVMNTCNRAILLSNGEIDFMGASQETVSRYYGKTKISVQKQDFTEVDYSTRGKEEFTIAEIDRFNILGPNVIRQGERQVEIMAVRVVDQYGKDTFIVNMFEPLFFYMHIKSAVDCLANSWELSAGIEIYDRFNNMIFSQGTFQQKKRIPFLKAGQEIMVKIKLVFNIQAGHYTFNIGLSNRLGFIQDKYDKLGPIDVVAPTIGILPFNGIVQLPMNIDIYKEG